MWYRRKPEGWTDICLLKNVGLLEGLGIDSTGTSMVYCSPNYLPNVYIKQNIICIRCGYECWTPSLQESLKNFRCDEKAGVCAGLFLILSSSFLCNSLLTFLPYVHVTVFPPWLGAFHLPTLGPLLELLMVTRLFTRCLQNMYNFSFFLSTKALATVFFRHTCC